MTTIAHINTITAHDLKDRTTTHSHTIARNLNAAHIIDMDDLYTFASLHTGHALRMITHDATGLNLGKDMIITYELMNLATRETTRDMLPVNTVNEATEILRDLINRAR